MTYTLAELVAGIVLAAIGIAKANQHTKRAGFWPRLEAVAIVSLGGMMLAGAVQWFVPAVDEMRAQVVVRGAGSVVMELAGVRQRSCRRVSVEAEAFTASGERVPAGVTRVDPLPATVAPPTGPANFGKWRVYWALDDEPVDFVRLIAMHDCGQLWPNVPSIHGPFRVAAQ